MRSNTRLRDTTNQRNSVVFGGGGVVYEDILLVESKVSLNDGSFFSHNIVFQKRGSFCFPSEVRHVAKRQQPH